MTGIFHGRRVPEVGADPIGARSGGQPLAPSVRRAMEARLGHSFADVRVHSDARAASEARALGARAFAVGRDVVFGARPVRARHAARAGAARARARARRAAARRRGGRSRRAPRPRRRAPGRAVASGRVVRAAVRTGPQVALPGGGRERLRRRAAAEAVLSAERAELADVQGGAARASRATASTPRRCSISPRRWPSSPSSRRPSGRALRDEASTASSASSRTRWPTPPTCSTRRIPELEARAAAGEDVKAEMLDGRRELADNRADLESLKGVFSPAKGAAFEETYRNKVAGLHCMGAAYAGLGALTSPEQSAEVKRQVAEKAEAGLTRKRPVEPRPVHHRDGHGERRQDRRSQAARRLEQEAQGAGRRRWRASSARASTPTVPGFYFFGLALAEAYHSVLIGVSTWDKPRACCGATSTAARSSRARSTTFARGEAEGYQIGVRRLGHVPVAGAAARRGEPARAPEEASRERRVARLPARDQRRDRRDRPDRSEAAGDHLPVQPRLALAHAAAADGRGGRGPHGGAAAQGRAGRDHQGRHRARRGRPARARRPHGTRHGPVSRAVGARDARLPARAARDHKHAAARARDDRDPAAGRAAHGVRVGAEAGAAGEADRVQHHRGGARPQAEPDPREGLARACACSATATCRCRIPATRCSSRTRSRRRRWPGSAVREAWRTSAEEA